MKKYIIILLTSSGFFSVNACKEKEGNAKCSNPNISASVGGTAFSACNAYAYNVVVFGDTSFAILGQVDAGNLLSFAFNVADKNLISPGTYQITDGVGGNPAGQPFRVNFVYKEGGAGLSNSFNSQSGTLILTVANGAQFKGTFSGSARRASGSPDVKTITNGSFDVNFK
jgi:hypothetical protein